MHPALAATDTPAIPVYAIAKGAALPEPARAWGLAAGYEASPGRLLLVPGADGALACVLMGVEAADAKRRDPFLAGTLATALPAGTYRLEGFADPRSATIAFLLGGYRFDRYKKGERKDVRLVLGAGVDAAEVTRIAEGVALTRDLVNTPANDMGPQELEDAFRALAERHGAQVSAIVGEELLAQNFPMIHAVGRASARAPRLLDMRWGDEGAPKVTLVGKGVCFDTGGLDIKPSSSMLLMKKDMGGAANVMGLAHMIMSAGLKLRLRVLVPAVENSISGNAFRPSDVLQTRKGITVEVGNTDAEGRLVLGDALTLADEEAPDLIIDMATLTGAARVATGPEVAPFYTDDEPLAADIARHAMGENDPLWRLPLWRPYEKMLDSKVADTSSTGSGGFAGSITAALFLSRFVENAKAWSHLDIYSWTPSAKPGRPDGADAQGSRALYAMLKERYS